MLQYRDGMKMTWQDGRKLASLQANGHMITYSYDANGMRYSKTVDGKKHTYYYESGKLMYEDRGNISLRYEYDSYGNLSMISYKLESGTFANYYVACNSRGDVEFLYNGDGVLRVRYSYDTWGNIISITDGNGNAITDPLHIGNVNPIRYRGYYYDGESGFYYLSSRYYDPQVKRFVNADRSDVLLEDDESQLQYNLFAYCWNNPVNMDDPDGCSPRNRFTQRFIKNKKKKKASSGRLRASFDIWANFLLKVTTQTYLRNKGWIYSALFLDHALQRNPSNLSYGNSSSIAKALKGTSEMKKKIEAFRKSGKSSSKVVDGFESGDFFGAFHYADLIMVKNKNGSISVELRDYYDFKLEWAYKSNTAAIFGNNYAWISQNLGSLNSFNITVRMTF